MNLGQKMIVTGRPGQPADCWLAALGLQQGLDTLVRTTERPSVFVLDSLVMTTEQLYVFAESRMV